MVALAATGKKSLAVDIMLRTLGLDMVADTLASARASLLIGLCGRRCMTAQAEAEMWPVQAAAAAALAATRRQLSTRFWAADLSLVCLFLPLLQVGNHMVRGISGG